jgi:PAS domain S-box-containing protein
MLSIAIANYVIRTRQAIVLSNASQSGQFTNDSYVVKTKPKSILCTPLFNHGRLTGLLYLENNLSPGIFTPSRLELLNLLSSQAAISLENAHLYTDLQANEKKYRTIFEESRDTIFITKPSGEIVDVSPACFDLLGYTRDEMLAMNAGDVYNSRADRVRFRETIERDGTVKDLELCFRRKDGRRVPVLLTANIWQAEDGTTILGYQGIIRDVTAQKQAEREKLNLVAIQRELEVAHKIQQNILPPPKPGWSAIDVICYSHPAHDVGGDFYAYYEVMADEKRRIRAEPPRYVVAVGDVSGKGTPAALLMAVSLVAFKSTFTQSYSFGKRIIDIAGGNNHLNDMFCTLDKSLGHYTLNSRQNCAIVCVEITLPKRSGTTFYLNAVNAGCIPPYIKRANGEVEHSEIGGFALGQGLGAEMGYQQLTLELSQGDMVILVSDGMVEANNDAGDMLGFDSLLQIVRDGPTDSVTSMLEHIKREVFSFTGKAEQFDDMTVVVVQV